MTVLCVCLIGTWSLRKPLWEAQSAQFYVPSHDGPARGRGFLSDAALARGGWAARNLPQVPGLRDEGREGPAGMLIP